MSDDRKYRVVRLTNGLDSFLISDMNSGVCAASLTVGSGSFQDDPDIPGLAHFTEHMIYLGSKCVKPGEFEDYLSNYFGITNAYTENEKTTYFFQVGCKGFIKSLMMFSKMFSEPLFDKNFMKKEINSVDSEYLKNKNQDPWRQNQLLKEMANKAHPFFRFNTGNNETLENVDENTLNKRLKDFYSKYYIPKNMKFAVLANLDIDTLQYEVSQYFSDLRQDSLQNDQKNLYGLMNSELPAFTPENLGKIVWFKKFTSLPVLDIVFYLEEVLTKYETKPLSYISYVLKYTGLGSLYKNLNDKKLAIKLDSGFIASYKNFSLFSISIELTEKGNDDPISVLKTTFGYLQILMKTPISHSIYDEIHKTSKIRFKFSEKKSNYGDYLGSLSNTMFDYNYQEILYGEEIHTSFNSTMIKSYLEKLTPENSIIFLGSDEYPKNTDFTNRVFSNSTNKTEVWYRTEYVDSKLDSNLIKEFKTVPNWVNYNKRHTNLYLTSQDNVVACFDNSSCYDEMNSIEPRLYYNQNNLKVWYRLDRSFLIPKVIIEINIISPYLRSNSKEYFFLNILYYNLLERLDSLITDLIESGNEFVLKFDENGFHLHMSLFTDLLERVVSIVLNTVFNPQITEQRFDRLMKFTIDKISSKIQNEPLRKADNYFNKIVKYNVTIARDIYSNEKITVISYEDFNEFIKKNKKSFSVVCLYYGSISDLDLNDQINIYKLYLSKDFDKNFFPLHDYLYSHKIVRGPVIFRVSNDLKTEKNDVVANYFQVGLKDYKLSLTMNIIEMIWGNMFYYHLRTVEQLGYYVSANKKILGNHMYFVFVVEGNTKNPAEMNLQIDNVLWRLRDKIINVPEKKFIDILNSIKSEISKKDTNLKERVKKVWAEIDYNTLDFKRKEKLLGEIDQINKSEILKAFDDIFIDDPKKISIQIYSSNLYFNIRNEEVYYLNANLNYCVTSDVKILDNFDNDKF